MESRCPYVVNAADVGDGAENLSLEGFDELLREHGAVLFRGVTSSQQDFLTLSDRFGHDWLSNPVGQRESVSAKDHLQTVNLQRYAVPPHCELGEMPLQPEAAWFFAERHPEVGGETTLFDGVELAAEMPQDLKQFFLGRSFRYCKRNTLKDALHSYGVSSREALCDLIESKGWSQALRLKGEIVIQDYSVPAFSPHRETGEDVFATQLLHNAYLRRYVATLAGWLFANVSKPLMLLPLLPALPVTVTRRGRGVACYPTLEDGSIVPRSVVQRLLDFVTAKEIRVAWQRGDTLVFDNFRVMHGRRKIEGPERRILTRFGQLRSSRPVGSGTA